MQGPGINLKFLLRCISNMATDRKSSLLRPNLIKQGRKTPGPTCMHDFRPPFSWSIFIGNLTTTVSTRLPISFRLFPYIPSILPNKKVPNIKPKPQPPIRCPPPKDPPIPTLSPPASPTSQPQPSSSAFSPPSHRLRLSLLSRAPWAEKSCRPPAPQPW